METSSVQHESVNWRRILVGCEFTYITEIGTPVIYQVQPATAPGIALESQQWTSKPHMTIRGYTDLYGNPCVRAVLPLGRSSFRYQAVAVVPDVTEDADEQAPERAPDALPDATLIYTLPSRYCLPDVLGDEAWSRFGGLPPGYRRVQAICDYVHDHLTFEYGSTGPLSSAADVNEGRHGVCRDFTHLAVSFCRALNIPARYVFGYLPDLDVPPDPAPMDFAAWMEVWLETAGGRSTRVTTSGARAASSSAGAGTLPTSPWRQPSARHCWSPWSSRPRRSPDDAGHPASAECPARSSRPRPAARPPRQLRHRAALPVRVRRAGALAADRLIIVPPPSHGNQYLRAHQLQVTGARARRRMHQDASGNVIAWLHAEQVLHASSSGLPRSSSASAMTGRRRSRLRHCTARGCCGTPR